MKNKVASVILAGGKGKRLGGVLKANIKIAGISLLKRAKTSFDDVYGTKLLSIGSSSADKFDLSQDWVAISDLGEGKIEQKGPLAGIAAAADYFEKNEIVPDFLYSLAVDSVFFPKDFYQRAIKSFEKNTDVVIATHQGQFYPTNAVWRFEAIKDLPKRFDKISAYGIRGMLKSMNVIKLEINSPDGGNPAQNINDIGDIIACGRRAKSKKTTKLQ